jgi:hypothetical protein
MEHNNETGDGFLSMASIALSAGAFVLVVYASYVYFRRIKLLSRGSAYGYIDHFGPALLAFSVISGVLVLLFYKMESTGMTALRSENANPQAVLSSQSGMCYQHSNNGISQMLYQPSDVAIDHKRNMLLVPSLDRIVGHPTSTKSNKEDVGVVTLAKIPNEDMEGLVIAGDRIFALSENEDSDKSHLIELEWQNERLEFRQRWEMMTAATQTEAIAYVPDDEGNYRLFITANGRVNIYDMPDALVTEAIDEDSTATTLQRQGAIGTHLLLDGLQDGKISGMYYFEEVLYVLHDNDCVIRAWDMDAAKLLAEITLPQVGGSFNKQWEGFAIERNDGSQTLSSGLRGGGSSSSSPLVVHMALDTPAQVWSFAVEEGSERGSFVFPSCAAAF